MPRGDRTGPAGCGARTGRGLGHCSGHDGPGYAYGGFGRRHHSFATGPVGWGHPRYAPPTRDETLADLKADADWLKEQLDAVNKRIDELEQ